MKSLKIVSFFLVIFGSTTLMGLPGLEQLKDAAKRQALMSHIQWITSALQSDHAPQDIHERAASVADGCSHLQSPWSRWAIRNTTGVSEAEIEQFQTQCAQFQAVWAQLQRAGTKQA